MKKVNYKTKPESKKMLANLEKQAIDAEKIIGGNGRRNLPSYETGQEGNSSGA